MAIHHRHSQIGSASNHALEQRWCAVIKRVVCKYPKRSAPIPTHLAASEEVFDEEKPENISVRNRSATSLLSLSVTR